MMARTHEATSALAWLGACTIGLAHPVSQVAAGTIIAAGAGLLPDLDHPSATPAHCLPPVSTETARCVHWAARGHREWTHTVAVTAAVGVGVWAAAGNRWAVVAILFVLSVFTLKVLGPRSTHGLVGSLVAGAAMAAAVWFYVKPGVWLTEAVVIGYAAHLAGDLLSEAGVPLLLPWSYRFRVPLEPVPVNSIREHLLASLCLLGCGWLAFEALTPGLRHLHV